MVRGGIEMKLLDVTLRESVYYGSGINYEKGLEYLRNLERFVSHDYEWSGIYSDKVSLWSRYTEMSDNFCSKRGYVGR